MAGHPPFEAQHMALPVHQKPATDRPGSLEAQSCCLVWVLVLVLVSLLLSVCFRR